MQALTFSKIPDKSPYHKLKNLNAANRVSSYPLIDYFEKLDDDKELEISLQLKHQFHSTISQGKETFTTRSYKITYLEQLDEVRYYLEDIPLRYKSDSQAFYKYNEMKMYQLSIFSAFHSLQYKIENQ